MNQINRVEVFFSFIRNEKIQFWSSLLFISLVGLVVIIGYQPFEQSVRGDGAYFTYMGQAICRSDSIYRDMACGYPPLVPMINAVCISLGRLVSIPSYQSPKLFAIFILLGSFLLMFLVTHVYTRRLWVGILAALMLMDIPLLVLRGITAHEPKILILFLSLAAIYFIQKKKWMFCGVMLGLAATCYQPAILSGLALTLVAYYYQKTRRINSLFQLSLGFLIGLLPSIIYLLLSGQINDFFQTAVLVKLIPKPQIHMGGLLKLYIILLKALRSGALPYIYIFIVSIILNITLLLFFRKKNSETGFFSPRFGGMTLMTFAWLIFALLSLRVQLKFFSREDMLPFYFLVAFWSAWGIWMAITFLFKWLKPRCHLYSAFRFSARIICFVSVLIMTVIVVGRSVIYEPKKNIYDQINKTEKILGNIKHNQPLLALGAHEIYVITERRSPWRYFNLHAYTYFDTIVERLEPDGCNTLLDDIYRKRFSIIVIGERGLTDVNGEKLGCFGRVAVAIENQYNETSYPQYRVFRLEESN